MENESFKARDVIKNGKECLSWLCVLNLEKKLPLWIIVSEKPVLLSMCVCVLYNKKKKLCFNRAEEKGGLQGQICKAPSPPPILPAAYKELSLGVGGISRSGLIFAIQDLRLSSLRE